MKHPFKWATRWLRWPHWLSAPKGIPSIAAEDLYEARRLLLEAERNLEDWMAYRDTLVARINRLNNLVTNSSFVDRGTRGLGDDY